MKTFTEITQNDFYDILFDNARTLREDRHSSGIRIFEKVGNKEVVVAEVVVAVNNTVYKKY